VIKYRIYNRKNNTYYTIYCIVLHIIEIILSTYFILFNAPMSYTVLQNKNNKNKTSFYVRVLYYHKNNIKYICIRVKK